MAALSGKNKHLSASE